MEHPQPQRASLAESHRHDQNADLDDDDTGDSLDGLVLSVVDSLGEDHNQRHARPTSAPPVEGNSISQSLFLGERQRTDSIQEFLTKSPGQMLGGGLRKRAQPQPGAQNGATTLGLDEVLTALPQMSLSSPTSPLGSSAARFDFLDAPRGHFPTPSVVQHAVPPHDTSSSSHHHRSLSQGSYAFQLGPGLLASVTAANSGTGIPQNSSTPHSSPPLSEVGDALEDRGTEVETALQMQIEELQRRLIWQRQMKQQPSTGSNGPSVSSQPQQQVPKRSSSAQPDWSNIPARQAQQQQQQYSNTASGYNMNGSGSNTGRYSQMETASAFGLASPLDADFTRSASAGPYSSIPPLHPSSKQKIAGMVSPTRATSGVSTGSASGMMAGNVNAMNTAFAQAQAQAQQAANIAIQYPPPSFSQEKLPVDAPLEQLEGRFLQLAQEQNGCRYLQQRIAREGPSGAALVLREVFPHLVQLMMDPFANYMYQKLLEHAAPEQRLRMLEAVQSSLLIASLNLHGTRSVQKHIEMGGRDPRQRDIIAHELAPFVTKLSMDTNGNHVVQRMLQHLDHCDFVCEAIIQDLLIVTRHRHGCCVVQRCLDASDPAHRAALITRIEESALQLMQDPFANYTVQYVIENGNPGEGLRIVELIRGKIETLSKQKFSSNVVERCLTAAPPHVLQQLVDEAIGCMGELLHDAFANFVAQKLLDPITNDFQARSIVAAMRPHLLDLNPSCSRRVANRIVKRFPDMMADDVIQKVLGGTSGSPTTVVGGSGSTGQPMMMQVPMQVVQQPSLVTGASQQLAPPPAHMSAMFRSASHPSANVAANAVAMTAGMQTLQTSGMIAGPPHMAYQSSLVVAQQQQLQQHYTSMQQHPQLHQVHLASAGQPLSSHHPHHHIPQQQQQQHHMSHHHRQHHHHHHHVVGNPAVVAGGGGMVAHLGAAGGGGARHPAMAASAQPPY